MSTPLKVAKEILAAPHIYARLRVHHTAEEVEIIEARNAQLRIVHPDRLLSHEKIATQAAAEVTQAASIMNDRKKHATYRATKFPRAHKCLACKGEGVKKKSGKKFEPIMVYCEVCQGSGVKP